MHMALVLCVHIIHYDIPALGYSNNYACVCLLLQPAKCVQQIKLTSQVFTELADFTKS